MCVIIVKDSKQQLGIDTAKKSARINPHGLGVVWLDTYKITYHKSSEYKVIATTKRPFIAHFRYATVGKVGKSNTHPFQCGKKENEYLMMNGTIKGLGDANTCDTKVLAQNLGDIPRHAWKDSLKPYSCRFVSINVRNKSYQIYNKELWTKHEGIWYSKANVLENNYVAVYGTLKKNYSNYWWYLGNATHIGKGKTYEKYPLIVKGLPYLINDEGKGHNVEIDLFRVTDSTLKDLDRLEGHPNWYRREQIWVVVKGEPYLAWIYFNIKEKSDGQVFHKSYKQNPVSKSYHDWDFDNYPVKSSTTKTTNNKLDSCDTCTAPATEPKTTYYYENTLFHELEQKEEKEFDVKNEKPMCINCFYDLDSDGYGNYFCNGCNDWFSENEIQKQMADFNVLSKENNALPF